MIPVMDRPLFTGLVEHSLDDKGRLVVPARFRAQLGSSFFLMILEPDGCIELCPPRELVDVRAKLEGVPQTSVALRKYRRHVFSNADEVSCDEQGRIMIPPAMRAWAEIKKNVVSVGAMSRVEVWAKERYERQLAELGDVGDFTSELGLS